MDADTYIAYYPKLHQYVYRRTFDPHLAEDIAQEVFAKALAAERTGQGAHTHQSGWLYRIAHNLVIDYYRARDCYPTRSLDEGLPAGEQHDPYRLAAQTWQREALHQALRTLTGEQAQAMHLRFWEGYTAGEVGARVGRSEGAVKGLLRRGYQTLRQKQEAIGHD